MSITTTTPALTTLLAPTDLRQALVADAREGLGTHPLTMAPKYFYDDRGSELFDAITRLPEYYPTRTERHILAASADEIVRTAGTDVLLELGSGSSEKTRLLLDAMARDGHLEGYVPVDVSEGALSHALTDLRRDYPGLPIHATVADFDQHLVDLPAPGRRTFALLGGTLGNYEPTRRATFLRSLAAVMDDGEHLLVGIDLVKDPARLVAAYDDAAGVTAEFNHNVLHVLNRELGADFDVDAFAHVARWDAEHEWIEMRLRASHAMTIHLPDIDLEVDIADGEEIRTEISAKFRREAFDAELVETGFVPVGWWTDPAADFAVVLAQR